MEVSDYYSAKDHFIVEDLFNFNNDDAGLDAAEDNGSLDAFNGSSTEYSSAVAAGNGYGSSSFSGSGSGQHFSSTTDFCQPVISSDFALKYSDFCYLFFSLFSFYPLYFAYLDKECSLLALGGSSNIF